MPDREVLLHLSERQRRILVQLVQDEAGYLGQAPTLFDDGDGEAEADRLIATLEGDA